MKRIAHQLLALSVFSLTMAPLSDAEAAPPGPTIVDVAIAANGSGPFVGQFDTLIAAVLAADQSVIETLSGNGQFTVFAPTDTAFAELGLNEGNVGALDPQTLTDILLYHVSRGRHMANSVTRQSRIRMMFPGFTFPDGATLTDNLGRTANIIATDVNAGNGVIHGIDRVVLPYSVS